jgi:exodeoxyribonuclease V alpha subunit
MHGQAPSTQSDTPAEALSGAVERVTFHSDETGFCVLRVKLVPFGQPVRLGQ